MNGRMQKGSVAWITALALVGCGAASVGPSGPATGERAETVRMEDLPTGASVSEAYRFALRPSSEWRILSPREVEAFGPAAAAGATRHDGHGWGAVVVESVPGLSLERAAQLVLDAFPGDDRTLVSQEPTFFLGYRALRQVVRARVQDMPVTWTSLLFLHQEHLYRLTVWGDRLGSAAANETFFQTFALLEGDVVRPPRESTLSAEGVDYRIDNGTFASLAAELRVQPSRGWRVVVGSDLRDMNADATVGLTHEEPDVYVVVLAERAPASQHGALTAHLTRTMVSSLGGQTHGTRTVRFLGRDVPLSILHADGFEYLFGVQCDEGLCRQLLIWYVEQAAPRAVPVLATMPEIRALTRAERDELATALARSDTERRTLGPTHAYRGNLFVDFRRGLTLRVPPRAYWRIHGDAEARELHEHVELEISNSVLGLTGLFMSEILDGGIDGTAYHADVRAAVGLMPGDAQRTTLGGHPAEVSEGLLDLGFGAMLFRVLTVRMGDHGYRFVLWGWPEHVRAARPAIDALFAGTTLHGGELPGYAVESGRFVERRFGYALPLPPGVTHSDETPTELGGASSVHTFVYPDGSRVQVLTVHAPGESASRGDLMLQTMRNGLERRLGPPVSSSGTLAGHPAEVSRWLRGPVPVEARIVLVGSIAYGLVVIGRSDGEAIARSFELLP